ncbi:dnaJ homolog subfamily B member 8 [Porphyrio hochstetteri]
MKPHWVPENPTFEQPHLAFERADYYEVLGLQRSASQDDVKKSCRKLALKWHPDKNPGNKEEAEKKFRAIAEAYGVLSDPQKRSVCDKPVKSSRSRRGRSATGTQNGSFDSPYLFHDSEESFRKVCGGVDRFVHAFWDPFDHRGDGENWNRTNGRIMPWNSFGPGWQPPFSFVENTAAPQNVRMVFTPPEVISGKKIITWKIMENGQERIGVEEDGQLKPVTINGRDHMEKSCPPAQVLPAS